MTGYERKVPDTVWNQEPPLRLDMGDKITFRFYSMHPPEVSRSGHGRPSPVIATSEAAFELHAEMPC